MKINKAITCTNFGENIDISDVSLLPK